MKVGLFLPKEAVQICHEKVTFLHIAPSNVLWKTFICLVLLILDHCFYMLGVFYFPTRLSDQRSLLAVCCLAARRTWYRWH